ncbi:MAG: flagellar protein FlaG [Pseudomonadales bacterium]
MVTNGVKDLVSPIEQAAIQHHVQQAEASSATQEKPKHIDAKSSDIENQKEAIPLESVVKQLNSYLENAGRSVSFSIHQDSGKSVVKVFNSGTDELIRQFPAEQALKLAEVMRASNDNERGLLFDAEA